MIAKSGDEDAERNKKMKNLLELLTNPTKRMPLETLLKCEKVLEKLDFKRVCSQISTKKTLKIIIMM